MDFIRIQSHGESVSTPTYHREVEELAVRHNYSSVRSLAASLPEAAEVVDVGAGVSRLGHKVAALRDDITWVNMDILYSAKDQDSELKHTLGRLATTAPKNLEYVAGSILSPPAKITPSRFSHVFSYWLLPHIVEANSRKGAVAAYNMIIMGKPGGTLSVGPRRTYSDNAEPFVIPGSSEEARSLAAHIVKPWVKKFAQR